MRQNLPTAINMRRIFLKIYKTKRQCFLKEACIRHAAGVKKGKKWEYEWWKSRIYQGLTAQRPKSRPDSNGKVAFQHQTALSTQRMSSEPNWSRLRPHFRSHLLTFCCHLTFTIILRNFAEIKSNQINSIVENFRNLMLDIGVTGRCTFVHMGAGVNDEQVCRGYANDLASMCKTLRL